MPSLCCSEARGRREHHVGRRGRDDDQVDVGSVAVRPPRAHAARLEREVAGGTSGRAKWRQRMPVRSTIHWSEVSMPPGAARGQVGVGHRSRRQVAAGAGDARISTHSDAIALERASSLGAGQHGPGIARDARCAGRDRAGCFGPHHSARSSACSKANASAEPWLLNTSPRRPSSAAPL